ncbi:hypothetical protein GGR53DRAFT_512197 [Hypoxylon sp. FL1150]|nr:hypothetical protein GGR53DRAFT_512197 [Hypoxylon sp. FL1150]
MSDTHLTSYTKFEVHLTSEGILHPSIFKPLLQRKADFDDAFYGQIAENGAFLLLVIWNNRSTYDAFTASAQNRELAINLGKQSSSDLAAATQTVDFGKVAYWWRLGVNTEFRIVYFPAAAASSRTRDAVTRLKGLVLTMGLGIDGSRAHLSPYRGVPTCGWVEGIQTWDCREDLQDYRETGAACWGIVPAIGLGGFRAGSEGSGGSWVERYSCRSPEGLRYDSMSKLMMPIQKHVPPRKTLDGSVS